MVIYILSGSFESCPAFAARRRLSRLALDAMLSIRRPAMGSLDDIVNESVCLITSLGRQAWVNWSRNRDWL